MNPKAYRLPHTVMPRHYSIDIDARIGSEELQGHVAIQLDIVAPCTAVELHARELQIREATLEVESRRLSGTISLDPDRELAIVQFSENLLPGSATLHLAYSGRLGSRLEGMFVSANGPERMICSQCETVYARAILPCFDEPEFKARFAWQVTTNRDAVVLTNGALLSVSESADGRSKTWSFAPTVCMSSYLLAVAIGNLASIPEEVVNGVPLRVWALAGREDTGAFALRYTARLLPWYEDYFGVPYHFAKLDQVAVPTFGPGAMENAGLIISQDRLLLLNPQTASSEQEKDLTHVVAHEFAHMWFGDLVTLRWWDDAWLNESFAEWIAFRAIDALSPEYDVWDQFTIRVDRVLETDALTNTHPIFRPVDTPQSIEENFDEITYAKGCAVLRMLERYLGEVAFRAGIRTYMHEYSEANATGDDLWRHLQSASSEPVTELVRSWILQPGHPIVRIEQEIGDAGISLRLSQQRFFSRRDAGSDNEQLWYVPLLIRYRDDAGLHEIRYLLSERDAELPLDVTGSLAWCTANAGDTGFYRQELDTNLLAGLIGHLDELQPAEQLALLRDQWALVANGSQSISAFLDTLVAVAQSDDYRVIRQITFTLGRLENFLLDAQETGAEALMSFRRWISASFGPKLAALGYEPHAGESAAQGQARAFLLDIMIRFAYDPAAIEQARAAQVREAADPRAVDANLAPVVVAAAAQFGDEELQRQYLAIYQQRRAEKASLQEIERYVNSFHRFQQSEMVERTFQWIDEDIFPFQDMLYVTVPMIFQWSTRRVAWEWIKSHWDLFDVSVGAVIPLIVQTIGWLPGELRSDVEAFFAGRLHGEFQSSVAQALEQMDQSAEVEARTRDDLLAWFTGRPQTRSGRATASQSGLQ